VIDPIGAGLGAVAARSALAYPLVFAAGIITSAGPCAAPRYITAAALAGGPRSWPLLTAFGTGIAGAYVALGSAAGTLGALYSGSRALYLLLALALAAGGAVTLLRAGAGHRHQASPRAGQSARASLGGAFLLGCASALVVSPCCTPVVMTIAGLTMGGGRSAEGAALLGAFGCGHALPVLAAGAIGTEISARVRAFGASSAAAVVAGSLMLALAAYYGTLA
jgi:cytochrome c biogenesis protein CcdA